MTGTSCGFLLTKSLDLPLYYSPFFSICMIILLLDSVYHGASDLVEDSIQEIIEDLLQV
jgi:hypothetical protein